MDSKTPQSKENDETMRNIVEEARVIIPGLQAVFGFQTAAVFSERFTDLDSYAKVCHLAGLGLIIVSMAMLLTPAVYYRALSGNASTQMVRVSQRSIRGALVPMSLGFSLDMLTVMSLATDVLAIGIGAAVATLAVFVGLWYIIPKRDSGSVSDVRGDESHLV